MTWKQTVYEYTDYRRYLADWIAWKQTTGAYSFRWFSRRAGFGAPNLLRLVIDGRRNLSPTSIQKFSKAIGMSARESGYFNDMVMMNQARTPKERASFFTRMTLNPGRRKAVPMEQAQLRLFQHWLGPVLYELISFPDFKADPDWILSKFREEVGTREIKQVLELLKESGWVKVQRNGKLVRSSEFVDSGDGVNGLLFHGYHEHALGKALDALSDIPPADRHFFVITSAATDGVLAEMKALGEKFEQDLLNLLEANSGAKNAVYQVSVQMFPVVNERSRRATRNTKEKTK